MSEESLEQPHAHKAVETYATSTAVHQPPLVISEEAREAAFSEILRYNHHQGQHKDRGCYVQQLLNQSAEKLTKENEELKNLCLVRDMDRAQAQLLLDVTSGQLDWFNERYGPLLNERQTLTTRIKELEAELQFAKTIIGMHHESSGLRGEP